ncbi:type II toxin-antitoxin system RelB/DinJ family antitoxin [Candidatus Peregrinibacteria bacterium]|nr:MAG: type II toxin-antitoxin system RelB/DinJ family antitoxin [Candidatus Peregrinibacteria bacterium]
MKLIQIRIDDHEKKEVELVLKEMGLNITTATLMFYKKIIQTRSIPFSLSAPPSLAKTPLNIPANSAENTSEVELLEDEDEIEFEDEPKEIETLEINTNAGLEFEENPVAKVKKPYFRKIKIN